MFISKSFILVVIFLILQGINISNSQTVNVSYPNVKSEGSVEIFGQVADSSKRLENVKVMLFTDGKIDSTVYTDKKGKFSFGKLKLGFDYSIWFSKENYCTKFLEVRTTTVPLSDLDGIFRVSVNPTLFGVTPALAERLSFMLIEPATVSYYLSSISNFDWDHEALAKYNEKVIRVLSKK